MFQITVLYDHPADTEAFDRHYEEVHVPLVTKVPGLQRFTVTRPVPGPDGARPPYHLVATLEFASPEEAGAGMGSPEGQATAADLGRFAQAGVTLLQGVGTTAVG